jgi:uncharacterized ParB-like nuclease family protein
MTETRLIALGDIAVAKHRLRGLRENTANALSQSMADQGQLQPIVVRPREDGGYWLVAGVHRLAAAKKLKWKEINCTVFDSMGADEAELAEIDENLIRAELSPAERALYYISGSAKSCTRRSTRRQRKGAPQAGLAAVRKRRPPNWRPSQGIRQRRPGCHDALLSAMRPEPSGSLCSVRLSTRSSTKAPRLMPWRSCRSQSSVASPRPPREASRSALSARARPAMPKRPRFAMVLKMWS